jgi:uncharacterized protein with PIN domain
MPKRTSPPTFSTTKPNFILDEMLKGLIRWLRFLGFHAFTFAEWEKMNSQLTSEAKFILVTASEKNLKKYQAKNLTSMLLKSDAISDQLAELNEQLNIFDQMEPLTICSECNIKIETIGKESVKSQIPDKIYKFYNHFWHCPNCKRIYWEGGHIKRLKDKLIRMGVPIQE